MGVKELTYDNNKHKCKTVRFIGKINNVSSRALYNKKNGDDKLIVETYNDNSIHIEAQM